jgi:thymidylate synthase (FAD)
MFVPCSVLHQETMGSDLTVVNAARVSLGNEVHEFTDRDERLIKYLVEHHHESPFFHPQIRFRIKIPIWMAREWFRHTVGLSRNEISRRYVDTVPEFHLPHQLRKRASNKKQGSMDEIVNNNVVMVGVINNQCLAAYNTYTSLLENGVCPEQARIVLPQNMMTEFIETGSLAAYARLCRLRISPDAQLEIQEVAKMISAQLEKEFPISWKYLTKNGNN